MCLNKYECHDINRQELIISLILAGRFLLDQLLRSILAYMKNISIKIK
jgi:hypothetical protein